jgi:hypothetical protein
MSKPTAEEILKKIRLQKATNINNINYNNYINDINDSTTSLICDSSHNQVEDISLCSSLGSASLAASPVGSLDIPGGKPQSKEIHFSGGSELPALWLNFKWDLFRNPSDKSTPQLRLNLNIVRRDGTQAKLTASLNSPHDRIWRKVTDEQRLEPHWAMVEQEYRIWRKAYGPNVTDWRASKFYQPGKKDSTEFVVFVREEHDQYQLRLFYRATMWDYILLKSSMDKLTIKQIQANQVATLFIGSKARKILTADDLGL